MGYHVNTMQCMHPNFLLPGQVYPMLMSSVPQEWGRAYVEGRAHDECAPGMGQKWAEQLFYTHFNGFYLKI